VERQVHTPKRVDPTRAVAKTALQRPSDDDR
jgi:hypothetical protein